MRAKLCLLTSVFALYFIAGTLKVDNCVWFYQNCVQLTLYSFPPPYMTGKKEKEKHRETEKSRDWVI